MADDEPELIRDPKTLRALAHPLRWKLMEVLHNYGPSTATQCAEVLDESVASCSYHLNMLAQYGFVAEVPGKGRQKPWRLVRTNQSWSSIGMDDETALAAEAAGDAFLEKEFSSMRDRFRRKDRESLEWREVMGTYATTEFLTAEEAAEVQRKIADIFKPFADRVDDGTKRPEGARPVRYFLATTVAPRRD
ncbi:ArsR/SmtB family transcription factor [Saccharothrix saharensis]|uniref:ArsR/SmtB family transcription factor n=1 Tax=Saccharothrix saharensis TaxID=571190 RepID=UPI0036CF5927